jgi:uncharacterized protein (DUF952 family)
VNCRGVTRPKRDNGRVPAWHQIRCRLRLERRKAARYAGRMTDSFVYKIARAADWAGALKAGSWAGSADDARDGFVHLSTLQQTPGTLARHFKNAVGLILIEFEATRLGAALKWEESRGGALFPHLFAPLQVGDARRIFPLERNPETGVHLAPSALADHWPSGDPA